MSVAKAYATALYEAAADAKLGAQGLESAESELARFAQLVDSSSDAKTVLFGPLITAREKVAVVGALTGKLGLSPLVCSFLELLARKNRLEALDEVRDAFRSVRLLQEGGLPAKLVSADPMSAADVSELADAFSKKLGKRVAFQATTDASLLAGVKVTVNGVTYDGTLRSELQRLRDQVSRTPVAK